MNADVIIDGIKTVVMSEMVLNQPESNLPLVERCRDWSIGVTDCPVRLRLELGEVRGWHCWSTDSKAVACSVMDYFRGLGMHADTPYSETSTYIYIAH